MIEIKLTGETPEDVFAQMRVFLGQEGKDLTSIVITAGGKNYDNGPKVVESDAPEKEKKTRAKKEVAAPAPELVKDAPKAVSLEDCRELGSELIKTGGLDALRELNTSFGVAKISELPTEKLPAFLKSCQEKLDKAKAIAEAV